MEDVLAELLVSVLETLLAVAWLMEGLASVAGMVRWRVERGFGFLDDRGIKSLRIVATE